MLDVKRRVLFAQICSPSKWWESVQIKQGGVGSNYSSFHLSPKHAKVPNPVAQRSVLWWYVWNICWGYIAIIWFAQSYFTTSSACHASLLTCIHMSPTKTHPINYLSWNWKVGQSPGHFNYFSSNTIISKTSYDACILHLLRLILLPIIHDLWM